MTIFAYSRVSTDDQTTDNQFVEIDGAGFAVLPENRFADVISGSVPATDRAGWCALMSKVQRGDGVVVSKIDRLGRDSRDMLDTVDDLTKRGVKVMVIQLGNLDLTSSTGAMMLKMLSAVAEFERDLIRERTKSGMARAAAAGVKLGAPLKASEQVRSALVAEFVAGVGVSALARSYGLSRPTVYSILDAAGVRGADC